MHKYFRSALLSCVCCCLLRSIVPASAVPEDLAARVTGDLAEISALLETRRVAVEADLLPANLLDALVKVIDPGGAVLTPAQARLRQEEGKGLFFGIGVSITLRENLPAITGFSANSPAAEAGLKVGDLILQIGERNTEGLALEEIVGLLRGASNEKLALVVSEQATNAPARRVALSRTAIQMPVTGMIEEWPQNIGYLKINGIYADSGRSIVQQLVNWKTTNFFGAILDLRGANGMDFESAAEIGSLFFERGVGLFEVRDAQDGLLQAYKAQAEIPLGLPLMVLINRETAGAAETLAALLQHGAGAMLIGEPTGGDNRLREALPLQDGRMIYIATRRIRMNQGGQYAPAGVRPDVLAAPAAVTAVVQENRAPILEEQPDFFVSVSEQEKQDRALFDRTKDDAILRRAVDILLGLKALGIKIR